MCFLQTWTFVKQLQSRARMPEPEPLHTPECLLHLLLIRIKWFMLPRYFHLYFFTPLGCSFHLKIPSTLKIANFWFVKNRDPTLTLNFSALVDASAKTFIDLDSWVNCPSFPPKTNKRTGLSIELFNFKKNFSATRHDFFFSRKSWYNFNLRFFRYG